MITIIDYGMGNLGSIKNMLKHLRVDSKIVNTPEELVESTKLILPGVGSFDQAMERIKGAGLQNILNEKALVEKIPILGICLGMQLMTYGSDEGKLCGLGWIPARAIRFPINNGLKVPHMGWNLVSPSTPSRLCENLPEQSRFYFVHSYYVKVENDADSILKTNYGGWFDSAIQRENIFGVQFHPEKSHRFGMELLRNFVELL